MRVTQKGQVTIPLAIRRALGIETGTDVEFELDERGARLVVEPGRAAAEIARMRGAGTVVDSSVLLDVFTEDPRWLNWSQQHLTDAAQRGGLIINAVVLAEIAPRFSRIETLHAALPTLVVIEEISAAAAFLAGHAHANYRRAGGPRHTVLPDFLIGAHAAVTKRALLTRDPGRVASHLPGTTLISPT